jgi:integrase
VRSSRRELLEVAHRDGGVASQGASRPLLRRQGARPRAGCGRHALAGPSPAFRTGSEDDPQHPEHAAPGVRPSSAPALSHGEPLQARRRAGRAAEQRGALPNAGGARRRHRPGVEESKWAGVDRPLYLVAAMTGLRQGELLALRWIDPNGSCSTRMRAPELQPEGRLLRGRAKARRRLVSEAV